MTGLLAAWSLTQMLCTMTVAFRMAWEDPPRSLRILIGQSMYTLVTLAIAYVIVLPLLRLLTA